MAVDATRADAALEARRHEQRTATESVRANFRHELDVPYGDHPSQVLDIYYPKPSQDAPATAAPVLVFLHGGGFRRGAPGFNAYHGRPYLESGSIFVSMGYRLVPDARFPDSVDDVDRGLQWLVDHLAERGGDPTRIVLSGHSAGAMLAAWTALRPTRPDLLKGLVLISGMYDITRHSAEVIDTASPRYVPRLFEAIEHLPPHTVIAAGDADLPSVMPDAHALHDALEARGGSVELYVEPDADHFQANRSFVTPGGHVAERVKALL